MHLLFTSLLLTLGLASSPTRGLAPRVPASSLQGPEDRKVTESRLKARFIYYFATYVKWPPKAFRDARTRFCITVVGDSTRELERALAGKKIHGRRPLVQSVTSLASDAAKARLRASHLVYITQPSHATAATVDRVLGARPVLLVSDDTKSLERGAAIAFFVHEKKVRFEISAANLKRRDLSASVKLLRLARKKPKGSAD